MTSIGNSIPGGNSSVRYSQSIPNDLFYVSDSLGDKGSEIATLRKTNDLLGKGVQFERFQTLFNKIDGYFPIDMIDLGGRVVKVPGKTDLVPLIGFLRGEDKDRWEPEQELQDVELLPTRSVFLLTPRSHNGEEYNSLGWGSEGGLR